MANKSRERVLEFSLTASWSEVQVTPRDLPHWYQESGSSGAFGPLACGILHDFQGIV